MDTIWNCGLGIDSDLQNDKDNKYYHKSLEVFKAFENINITIIISLYFTMFFGWKAFVLYNQLESESVRMDGISTVLYTQ